ncbi:hypothetical protein K154306013_09010 [Clostridium tetani]|nr:hypothetical protein DP127_07540 [Clostridium tetani]BDR75241.1 hypothetical protein K154306013_09010 [Clostridium tetani]
MQCVIILKHRQRNALFGGEEMRQSNVIFANLRAEMARKQITIAKLAEEVGVNRDTMSRKLSGKTPLYLNEAFLINKKFFPNENIHYLFNELCKVSQKQDKKN